MKITAKVFREVPHLLRNCKICVILLLVLSILGCASLPKGFKKFHSGAAYHVRSGTIIPKKLGPYILRAVFDRYYGTIGFGAAYRDENRSKALLYVYVYPLTVWGQTSTIEKELDAVTNFYGTEGNKSLLLEIESENHATIAILYDSDEKQESISGAYVDIKIIGEWLVRKWAMWLNLPSDAKLEIDTLPSIVPNENVAS